MSLRVVHDCVNSWTSEPCRARRLSFMHQVWRSGLYSFIASSFFSFSLSLSLSLCVAVFCLFVFLLLLAGWWQSVAATRLLECACAMGVTRVQINFGES